VKDDGVGVDTIHKSYGILGIEERMEKWNGVCTLNSTENNGFSLKVKVKFNQEERFDDSNNNSR
jgi:signal transduction histidine kinase